MGKPTLNEIAAMPFPASERALQEYYGVEPWREGGPQKTWAVNVEYSWTEFGSTTVEVEASDESEAIKLARKEVCETEDYMDDFEIDRAEIVMRPRQ